MTPLVSAAIIQSLSWRWVFWIIALIVAFSAVLLFLFVPETFWDRSPIPKSRTPSRPPLFKRISSKWSAHGRAPHDHTAHEGQTEKPAVIPDERSHKDSQFSTVPDLEKATQKVRLAAEEHHVQFATASGPDQGHPKHTDESIQAADNSMDNKDDKTISHTTTPAPLKLAENTIATTPPPTAPLTAATTTTGSLARPTPSRTPSNRSLRFPWHKQQQTEAERQEALAQHSAYSRHWREREAKSFVQQLRPWHGRLNQDNWFKVAIRPFILFAYPSVLWSAAIYSCSVGWLIVVSESVTVIYREDYYHFNALQTGLMYISPFIGGVLGTAVAGKVSDVIVKAMARRNGGLYEPEFRLVMAIPILFTTLVGLMGYGWAAEERDLWIVPTVFLGVISFGCSLGSTTAITFCVDSYRQYAGEALVTLNFSKNIFHGLVFSFFVTGWIETDGAKSVFIWVGVIQLFVLLSTVPMFMYGKRARMWTIRKNFMEKF